MRVCPSCGNAWIVEERSPIMVCREIRLLDINHGEVDVDETISWHSEEIVNFYCNHCGKRFYKETIAELWEELDED